MRTQRISMLLLVSMFALTISIAAQEVTPTYEPITPQNAALLRPSSLIGYGVAWDAATSPAGNQIAVGTATGTWLFDTLFIGATRLTESETSTLAWNRDGTRLATGHRDGMLRVWDMTTQTIQIEVQAHRDVVLDLTWSPDNTQIITGGGDGAVHIWESSDGSEFYQLPPLDNAVLQVSVSINGQIASATFQGLYYWNTQLGVAEQIEGYEQVAAFSPDGRYLLTLDSAGSLVLLDPLTRAPVQTVSNQPAQYAPPVAWSPDGTRFAYQSTAPELQIFDVQAQSAMLTPLTTSGAFASTLMWSSDGLRLSVFASTGQMLVVTPDEGRSSTAAEGFNRHVQDLAWSPDGAQIALTNERLQVWDVALGRLVTAFEPPEEMNFLSFIDYSADGTQIIGRGWAASLVDGTITAQPETFPAGETARIQQTPTLTAIHDGPLLTVYDTATQAERYTLTVTDSSFGLSPDGTRLAVLQKGDDGDFILQVYAAMTGDLLNETPTPYQASVGLLAFSPDNGLIAAPIYYQDALGEDVYAVIVWDTATGTQLAQLSSGGRWGQDVEFSPDGTRLATADIDGAVILWAVGG